MQSLRSGMFLMPADEHGCYPQALATVATLNLAVSGTSNGDFIPGDRAKNKIYWTIIRVASDKDVWLAYGVDSATADATGELFLAGTEAKKMPAGTNFIAALSKDGLAGTVSVSVLQ